jgi:type I restriction enzyme S subunit
VSRAGWTTATLGELADVDRRVEDPAQFSHELVDLYSLPAYDAGRRPERTQAAAIKSAKLRLSRPAVLVSRLNPHIPRVWLARPEDVTPALASTEFSALVPRDGDVEYLYAACLSSRFQHELARRVNGTSNSHQRVKPQDLLSLEIPVPSRADRERIGSTVAALERRRVISERMAVLSDQLLRELFRTMFPDVFKGTERLATLADFVMGVSYKSSELAGSEQALVTLKCFGRDGSYREAGLKPWNGEPKPGQVVEEGDVVVAHTDLTQAAEVLGRAVVVRRSTKFKRLAASLDMAVLRPGPALTREFLLGLTRQPHFRRYCQAHANGTTVLHLARGAVPNFPLAVPDAATIDRYSNAAKPLLGRQLVADEERLSLQRIQAGLVRGFFG